MHIPHGCGGFLWLWVGKGLLDVGEFLGCEVESVAVLPVWVEGHEVDVGVGNIGADDFPEDAGVQLIL